MLCLPTQYPSKTLSQLPWWKAQRQQSDLCWRGYLIIPVLCEVRRLDEGKAGRMVSWGESRGTSCRAQKDASILVLVEVDYHSYDD